MSVISFCLGRLRRRVPAASDARGRAGAASSSCDAARECEPLLSFSELVAASSFLDFGGVLDARWHSRREPEEGGDLRRK
jgi:hypothetical protein